MDGVRQRHARSPSSSGFHSRTRSVVKNLDLFPKVHDDYVIRTKEGGITSLVTLAIMVLLALMELVNFFTPHRNDVITVRESSEKPMFINFNITTFDISCGKLAFDIADEDGIHSFGSSLQLVRMNLNENGTVTSFYRPGAKRLLKSCGYCYGANESGCCDTCEDVLTAYKERGWDTWMLFMFAPICQKSQNLPEYTRFSRRVGCMLWGALDVNQVAGTIRIATRTGQVDRQGNPLYDRDILERLNSTHYIEHFSFGDHIPGIVNPLDHHYYHSDHVSSHTYHLQMLPATYRSYKHSTLLTSNDISVHETDYPVNIQYDGTTDYKPGIFFEFQISPYMHLIEETKKSFHFLLIRLCAVIGGVMAISRLVDGIFYYIMRKRF